MNNRSILSTRVRIAAALLLPLSLAGCFGKPADISSYMERAKQNLADGQVDKARVELANALKLSPTDPAANLAFAKIEDAAGNLQSAVPRYLRAAVPEARLLEAQLRVVDILINSERLSEALGRINTTLGAFPDNADALALRADIEAHQNQDQAARGDVSAVLQKDPTNARALAVAAQLELRTKNGQQALALVTRGLTKHSDDLRLLQVQAAALLTLDQPDKAVESLKAIVKAAPRNIAAQVALAQVETQDGHFDQAFANLKAAAAADPSNGDMKLALVGFLQGLKKDQDLVAYLSEQIAKAPKDPVDDLILAEFYRTKGDLASSQAVLTRAAARFGADEAGLPVRVALAKVAAAQGKPNDALTQVDAVLATAPDNKDALLFKAVLEMNNGQAGAAVSDASKVTRADPVNAQTYEVLATAYMQVGQTGLGIDSMRRAVAVAPGDDRAQIRLATFLQHAGDLNGARDIVARQTLSHPEAGDIWVMATRMAMERGDWAAASNGLSHLRDIGGMAAAATALEGQMQAAQGNPVKAAASFRSLIDADANVDPTIIGAYSAASVAAKQADGAIAYLQSRAPALQLSGQVAAAGSIMTMQADAGRFDESDRAFAQAARLAPTNLQILNAHVRILSSRKNYDAALAAVTAAKAAGADAATCEVILGQIEQARGNLAAAQGHYKQALDVNPLSVDALNNYASLTADLAPKDLVLLGQLRKRFEGLEVSTNAPLVDTIAWLDYRLGRLDEAKLLLDRIGAGKSADPQLRFHAAAVLLAQGDKQAAAAMLDTVKDQAFIGAEEAKRLSTL